jgi:YgiT-type zinc finger domain-containing protein
MHRHIQPLPAAGATLEQVSISCPQCGSAKVKPALVKSAFWHKDRLVVVEDLPALVCGECHEQFYDDATAMLLDLMRGRDFPLKEARRVLEVPVFSFSDHLPRDRRDDQDEGVIR